MVNNGGWNFGNNGGFNFGNGGGWNFGGGNSVDRGSEPIMYTFADWEMNIPILKILVYNNLEQFKSIVREVLVAAFNPAILEPHIEELKKFLLPYIEEDSTVGADGTLPGRINKAGKLRNFTVSDFEDNIETGLKYWIKTKFEVACDNYGFDKDEILKETLSYVAKPFDYGNNKQNKDDDNDNDNDHGEMEQSQQGNQEAIVKQEEKVQEQPQSQPQPQPQEDVASGEKENTSSTNSVSECWSEVLGYSCCKDTCYARYTDQDGKWGVENNQWCGIINEICDKRVNEAQCFGEVSGEYPCCESCDVRRTDKNGDWGVENNAWCSIKYSCKN